ncbi:uncharacterized protein LOC100592567 [Nomascus leucogenys]|uniref:uncharacterized protein LOC100592567 n=1 Tax=Nomascus leucogenys TaxID=61853 RepID=UPI00122D8876|nr:uncharacterized protein LOC100592567 [Nomascus leucogenys]
MSRAGSHPTPSPAAVGRGSRWSLPCLAAAAAGLGVPRRTRPISPGHRSRGNAPGSRSGPRRLRAPEPREEAGPKADSAAASPALSGKQRPPPATVVGEKKGARRPGLLPGTPRARRSGLSMTAAARAAWGLGPGAPARSGLEKGRRCPSGEGARLRLRPPGGGTETTPAPSERPDPFPPRPGDTRERRRPGDHRSWNSPGDLAAQKRAELETGLG